MNVSFGDLRQRVLDMRAMDSPGPSFDDRVRKAANLALDRLSGDVAEALVPDEEHIVLMPDVVSSDAAVDAVVRVTADPRVLEFRTAAGGVLTSWAPPIDGTWDSTMHLEFTDPSGQKHRRQALTWWRAVVGVDKVSYVTLDRPWPDALVVTDLMAFRVYQREFYVRDDVMEVLFPGRVYNESRHRVWSVSAGEARRQDLDDYGTEDVGPPRRMWRGRHTQLPAPSRVPTLEALPELGRVWAGPERQGTFQVCYTLVKGRTSDEWQDSPLGIRDPVFESAPSPVSASFNYKTTPSTTALKMVAENIDAITGFDVAGSIRRGRSGYRIRFYIARTDVFFTGAGTPAFNLVETKGVFYLLAEVNASSSLNTDGTAAYIWDGSVSPDYFRPLKHSTGYYSYRVYPHQDARYEVDFKVLRLPVKFQTDTDTAPIQRDAIPTLVELILHYVALLDGADQQGAQIHLNRYEDLARKFRARYANPSRVVNAVPITGFISGRRYGTFSSTS